jgi:protoporphyrinogen oxidase
MLQSDHESPGHDIVIIGAGPAGLTAAYQFAQRGVRSTVLESDDIVGGISRTVERDGYRFDIGGHRFFTKVEPVEAFWHEILADDEFLLRPRLSRIYYQNKYFDYPLKAGNVLRNVGIIEAVLCVLSYLWARIHPPKDQTNLEGWVAARFGWRLYRALFKTYNEKLWGVPASEIQADWAAQRIKNLSLFKAAVNMLDPRKNKTNVTSLIEQFQYPMYGPGMMWERCTELVEAQGTKVLMEHRVVRIRRDEHGATAVVAESGGSTTEYPATEVISSMPLSALVRAMDPPAPSRCTGAPRTCATATS